MTSSRRDLCGFETETHSLNIVLIRKIPKKLGTLSKDDDGGSENVGKKMNLRAFKLNRVYLDPFNMSNAGDFSWS